MDLPDCELVLLSARGNLDAYAELISRHRKVVYETARAVLGCPEEAQDAAQDTFIRAFRAIGSFQANRAFAPWIRRIAVNCAVSRLSRSRRRGLTLSEEAAWEVASGTTPEAEAARADLGSRLRRAVAELPLKQRLAVGLFHLDGLSLAETAAAIGCSVGALKSHLHRARARLARELDEPEDGLEA